MWAFAQREAMELRHDSIRLAFAIIGPIIVLCAATWGLSFDVEDIRFSVLDRDQSTDSRRFVEHFAGSTHFVEMPPFRRRQRDRRPTALRPVLAGDRPAAGLWA
jgi:ribosome-dependent ATPase